MSKKAFDKIAAGLTEAIEIARGKKTPARLHVPTQIDVRELRHRLAHTQATFASTYGFTLSQIRQWEQDRCGPTGALRAYLTAIERDPEGIAKSLQRSEKRSRARARG
jgi:putative transcriptional regulator